MLLVNCLLLTVVNCEFNCIFIRNRQVITRNAKVNFILFLWSDSLFVTGIIILPYRPNNHRGKVRQGFEKVIKPNNATS